LTMSRRPILLAVASKVRPEELVHLAGPTGLIACDFYVEQIERGAEVPGGYERDGIVNVDHHAPTERMNREICSTNLAIERLAVCGLPPAETPVVINHTDCDSVLTAALLLGQIAPEPRFGAAAIAADHTGEADAIADLLQALDPHRDFAASLDALRCLESGKPLPAEAERALAERRMKRRAAKNLVDQGTFKCVGPVAFAILSSRTDGEFFPSLLPDTALIAVFVPHAGSVEGPPWDAKLRLGQSAYARASLHDLSIGTFDPAYGGRWNAGSNRRGGGSHVNPVAYVEWLARAAAGAWLPTRADGPPAT
jgi:hypothetical protein